MNQWIFLIDGYGMAQEHKSSRDSAYDSVSSKKDSIVDRKSTKTTKSGLTKGDANSDVFKTFIVRFIGNKDYSFYNVEKPSDSNKKRIDDTSET